MTPLLDRPSSASDPPSDMPGNRIGEAEPLRPKALQILKGARSVFLEQGYEGASVDEIARRAGVSKPTLYNHFKDKEALFAACFAQECEENAKRLFPADAAFSAPCAESCLRQMARLVVHFLLSPFWLAGYRNAVAEAARFPDLGRAFHASGPELGKKRIAAHLSRAVEAGLLDIPDLDLAAYQFMELCKAGAFHKRLFFVESETSEEEMARIADAAVDVFVKGYRAEAAARVPAG